MSSSKKISTSKSRLLQCLEDDRDRLIHDSGKFIMLKSSDGEVFEVEKAVAMEFQTIKSIYEDRCIRTDGGGTITVHSVTGKILCKIINYCKRHIDAADANDDDLKAFDADFVDVDNSTLYEICLAANYLNIEPLLDLTCQAIADKIKEITPAEIRKTFNIQDGYTPEQEEEVRRENVWAFE